MGISQVYKVFSFPWWSFAAFKAHFRGFELRAEGWERWQGEKRRGGGEEEGQWARILNITYANIQIAKCWSFPHSAFRMEISQVCKAFSFPCWSFAAFKAHLSRFRACFKVKLHSDRMVETGTGERFPARIFKPGQAVLLVVNQPLLAIREGVKKNDFF